jgi:hypothetical protein
VAVFLFLFFLSLEFKLRYLNLFTNLTDKMRVKVQK